jgi:hypothetical protein
MPTKRVLRSSIPGLTRDSELREPKGSLETAREQRVLVDPPSFETVSRTVLRANYRLPWLRD